MPGRVAALLVTATLLVAACGSSSAPSGVGTGSVKPTQPPVVVNPTSEELIASSLAAGTITLEDSLVYRALALYNSPDLPEAFHSAVPDMEAAGSLLQDIRAHESTLSSATLAKLAPYRVRPADPTSIYNAAPAVAQAAGVALGAILPGAAGAAAAVVAAAPTATVWKGKPAAGGKARVWVKDSPDAEAQLTTHAADVDRVWNAYPGIFTYPKADKPADPSAAINPDGAIDFYFVAASDLDPRRAACDKNPTGADCQSGRGNAGYADRAPEYSGRSSSGYLVIDAAASGDNLVDTMAHELAHAAQFNYDYDDTSWLYESTATWVAYKVMKKLNLEPSFAYNRATDFYGGLDKPLTRLDNRNAYGAWLFFLYASMEKGDGVVVDVWKAAAADGVQGEQAVDKVFPFEKSFAGFAVRNWNQTPVTPKYDTVDAAFPDLAPTPRNKVEAIAGSQEDSLDVSLPKLATAYFDYSFESSARAVTFENSLAGAPNAHVWAIKQIGDQWKPPEDWTGLDKKKFCRDAPEENITRLVLIVANSSVTDKLTAPQPPKISGDAKGCVGWSGTMKGTLWWKNAGYSGTSTGTFSGIWVVDESIYAQGCETPDCIRFIPEGTVSWTWDATEYTHGGGVKCHLVTSGSLPAVDKFGLGDQQYLYLKRTDENHYHYWGQGNYYLDQAVQSTINCSGFVGDMPNSYPPSFVSLDERASSANGNGGGNTCYGSDLVIDAKATTITGSCYDFKTEYNWEQFEWNLTRIGSTGS
jgi:hypothetical protein